MLSASWTPENPSVGDSVTFSATVRNAGDADAPAFKVKIEDKSAGGWTSHFAFPDGLAARKNGEASFAWTAGVGRRDFVFSADSENKADESDESDNSHKLPYNGTVTADLFIRDIEWSPQTPSVDSDATVSVIVENKGTDAAAASVARFVIKGSHPDDLLLDIPAIPAGGSVRESFKWRARLGKFTFTATADSSNKIIESDENNNTLVNNYNDTAQADLTITGIKISPREPAVGGEVTVRVTVENIGVGDAGESYAALYINNSKNPLDTAKVKALGAGRDRDVYFDIASWPNLAAVTLRAVADSRGAISESSENNNSYQYTWRR